MEYSHHPQEIWKYMYHTSGIQREQGTLNCAILLCSCFCVMIHEASYHYIDGMYVPLLAIVYLLCTLQWRHNGRDGVSNHRHIDCLLNRLFGRRSKKTSSSELLAFVRGIHRWPGNSPHKGPATRKMLPFDDVIIILLDILRILVGCFGCSSFIYRKYPQALITKENTRKTCYTLYFNTIVVCCSGSFFTRRQGFGIKSRIMYIILTTYFIQWIVHTQLLQTVQPD